MMTEDDVRRLFGMTSGLIARLQTGCGSILAEDEDLEHDPPRYRVTYVRQCCLDLTMLFLEERSEQLKAFLQGLDWATIRHHRLPKADVSSVELIWRLWYRLDLACDRLAKSSDDKAMRVWREMVAFAEETVGAITTVHEDLRSEEGALIDTIRSTSAASTTPPLQTPVMPRKKRGLTTADRMKQLRSKMGWDVLELSSVQVAKKIGRTDSAVRHDPLWDAWQQEREMIKSTRSKPPVKS